ncbi:MAG: hypothetical protein WA659_00020 [Candidatus Aquirickettsiella sp.]
MKRSHKNLKKGISDNPIPKETNQEAEVATTSKKTTSTTAKSSFSIIFQRLICSPSANLSDDTSEIVPIPKPQPK